jgi:hypothetical protein
VATKKDAPKRDKSAKKAPATPQQQTTQTSPSGGRPAQAQPQPQPRKREALEKQGSSGSTTSRRARTTEEIAQRAYELWLKRGGQHGSDQDDWLRAERELGGEGTGRH